MEGRRIREEGGSRVNDPIGEVPPQNLEAEQSVLGSILLDDRIAAKVIPQLQKKDFYRVAHQWIFSVMQSLFNAGDPVDLVSVHDKLKSLGLHEKVGGASYLTDNLIDMVPTPGNGEYYARKVLECARRRRIIDHAKRLMDAATTGSDALEQEVEQTQAELFLPPASAVAEKQNAKERLDELVSEHLSREEDVPFLGITTGFPTLDRRTNGLQAGQVWLIAARPGMGKCHGVDTPILMFDGSVKKVQEIQTGDLLMGPDSRPRRVLSTTQGHGPLYRVIPIKGESWVCNDAHVLSLKCSGHLDRNLQNGSVENIPLHQYLQRNERYKHRMKLWRTGVEFPSHAVPLDPYIFGVWLGDGSKRDPVVTKQKVDAAVCFAMKDFAEKEGYVLRETPDHNTTTWRFSKDQGKNAFCEAISLSVIDGEKRIPTCYRVNSREQRLQLLAGMIDTDGELASQCYVILTEYPGLARDLCFLARSLGFSATQRTVRKRIKSSGFEADYEKIVISGDTDLIPCKLERKRAGTRRQVKDVLRTGFQVEPLGEGDYYGFTLEGDHLYLLGDFTVTHNTSLGISMLRHIACKHPALLLTMEQTIDAIWNRFLGIMSGVPTWTITNKALTFAQQQRVNDAYCQLREFPLTVEYLPGLTAPEMHVRVRQAKKDGQADVVMIDHIGLLDKGGNASRYDRLTQVSNRIKETAGECEVPIISLVQLSRGGEKLEDKRPTLDLLRDTGAHEENAHCVIGVYREDYYETVHLPASEPQEAELLILKAREGETGRVRVEFIPERTYYFEERY